MATEYLFSNNATTTLAQSVSPTATVLNVASGTGGMFPNPGSGQAFAVTLVDASTGLTNEICYCTSRSGDQLTVIRGQEGTNATSWQAGDTCANYITADVMESWLQDSDLNGYMTETAGDARYVRNNGGTNGGITRATIDPTTGQPSFLDGEGNWHVVQYYGSYATTAQLNTEIQRATTIENNLQSSKYDKTGGTISGTVAINGGGGLFVAVDPGGQTSGGYTNYGNIVSQAGGRGGSFGFYVQEHVGYAFNGVIVLTQSNNTSRFLGVPGDTTQRLNDSVFGNFAYTSDLANYQPKGDYSLTSQLPTSGTITGGTYTKIGNVLTQAFTIYVPSNGTNSHRISYPMAFSGSSTATFNLTDSSQSRSVSLSENTQPDASGFNIAVSGHGNTTFGDTNPLTLTVIAQGIAA